MKTCWTLAMILFAGAIGGCEMSNQNDTTITQSKMTPPTTETKRSRKSASVNFTPEDLIQPLPEGQVPRNVYELQRRIYTEFSGSVGVGHERMAPSHGLPISNDRYLLNVLWLQFADANNPRNPTNGHWEITNVQLIGVVKNRAGLAYEVDKDDARMGSKYAPKTRPLVAFEKAALEKIREGTNVEVKVEGENLRMVGAIRATSQDCMRCHQNEKYKLLGAFSYDLKRAKW